MKEGKISPELLRSLVFNNIKVRNEDVILRSEIGEDCAAIDFGSHACILSTDPITGAVKDAGALAIHVSCNDVATSGVRPIGIMMTVLAPPKAVEEDIKRVMEGAGEAALKLGVEIIGGHTEITSAVNRIVISTTAIGKAPKDRIVRSSGAKTGDDVIMTKWAGLEGTSIIASDKEKELETVLTPEDIESVRSFIDNISVVEEGVTAGEFGASSMHDVTEGGVLGAAWEIAESSKKGIDIFIDKIPVREVTKKICSVYGIDPYRLISSGSMLITASNGAELVRILEKKGIASVIIGRITDDGRNIIRNGKFFPLNPPDVDELYKSIR